MLNSIIHTIKGHVTTLSQSEELILRHQEKQVTSITVMSQLTILTCPDSNLYCVQSRLTSVLKMRLRGRESLTTADYCKVLYCFCYIV